MGAAKLVKQLGVEAPLINAVATVLEGKKEIRQVGLLLMTEKPAGKDFAEAAHVMEKKLRKPSNTMDTGSISCGLPSSLVAAIAVGEALLSSSIAVWWWQRRS